MAWFTCELNRGSKPGCCGIMFPHLNKANHSPLLPLLLGNVSPFYQCLDNFRSVYLHLILKKVE